MSSECAKSKPRSIMRAAIMSALRGDACEAFVGEPDPFVNVVTMLGPGYVQEEVSTLVSSPRYNNRR
jgi:hypothetical protein